MSRLYGPEHRDIKIERKIWLKIWPWSWARLKPTRLRPNAKIL